jgi:major membrane immunogen (membrane-anchored lipoprotein)
MEVSMRHAVVLILIVVAVALLLGACARRDRTDYGALARGVGQVLERDAGASP